MAITTLTGSTHPLSRRVMDLDRAHAVQVKRWQSAAEDILADHRDHGGADQTVYDVDTLAAADIAQFRNAGYTVDLDHATAWRRVGPGEDHRHLLTQRGYIAVTGRDPVDSVAVRLAGPAGSRTHDLRDAATAAAPMVSALLAMLADTGLQWDTDETLTEAGRRVALDAAWRRVGEPNPALPRPRNIFAAAVDDLGLTDKYRDAAVAARWWLEHHARVTVSLPEQGIQIGGEVLDSAQAADRAGISRSTWAGYVSRGEAPGGDTQAPARWLPATVDAWRLTRPRVEWLAW